MNKPWSTTISYDKPHFSANREGKSKSEVYSDPRLTCCVHIHACILNQVRTPKGARPWIEANSLFVKNFINSKKTFENIFKIQIITFLISSIFKRLICIIFQIIWKCRHHILVIFPSLVLY